MESSFRFMDRPVSTEDEEWMRTDVVGPANREYSCRGVVPWVASEMTDAWRYLQRAYKPTRDPVRLIREYLTPLYGADLAVCHTDRLIHGLAFIANHSEWLGKSNVLDPDLWPAGDSPLMEALASLPFTMQVPGVDGIFFVDAEQVYYQLIGLELCDAEYLSEFDEPTREKWTQVCLRGMLPWDAVGLGEAFIYVMGPLQHFEADDWGEVIKESMDSFLGRHYREPVAIAHYFRLLQVVHLCRSYAEADPDNKDPADFAVLARMPFTLKDEAKVWRFDRELVEWAKKARSKYGLA